MSTTSNLVALALVASLGVSTSAWAKGASKKAPPPPPGPAPSVTLTVAPVTAARWTLRLENTGSVPVRVVADARLLSLEITPPADAEPVKTGRRARGPKVVHCTLPSDARPGTDLERAVVVPPGKAYTESFDPRLYCFGAKEAAALHEGATAIAHFGWTPPKRAKVATGPFVVSPVVAPSAPATTPPFAPAREVVAAPITLSAEAALTAPAPGSQIGDDADTKLALGASPRVDAGSADAATVTVTLTNEGPRPTSVLFRPGTVGFDVTPPAASGAKGPVRCAATGSEPIRELVTPLGVRGRAIATVLPDAVCPGHTFDLPGLYEVRPRYDARGVSGAEIGARLFAGQVVGPPFLLRIRRGRPLGTALPTPRVE